MPDVGLRFDLSAWRKGIRDAEKIVKDGLQGKPLKHFDRQVKNSTAGAKKEFGGLGGFISRTLLKAFAPLLGLLAIGAIFSKIKQAIGESLKAFRDYSDSVTQLRAALGTLGADVNMDAAVGQVRELGNQLRMALGVTGAEVNRAFSDFITRGFDTRQARQLTILAANYAKKTGKPLADIAKKIADAANGSVDAIKDLGVQVSATGDKVRDSMAAVAALKGAFGEIGTDLANPSERLAAAWNALAVAFGERIAPILEPVIQGFADFVTGLTQTERGAVILDRIAQTLGTIVNWLFKAIETWVNWEELLFNFERVIWATMRKLAADLLKLVFDTISKLPGSDYIFEKLGFDPKTAGAGFAEAAAAAKKEMETAQERATKSLNGMFGGEGGNLTGGIREMMEAGKRAREEAARALREEMSATRDKTFAGRVAYDAEAAKKKQGAVNETAVSNQARRVAADAGPGTRVTLVVQPRGRDRLRKLRPAW